MPDCAVVFGLVLYKFMRLPCSLPRFALASIISLCATLSANSQSRVDLSKIVVVGDSLSAGVQNFSLLDTQQPNGYASVVAQQAGVPLVLPLVPYPGAPSVLTLTSLNPVTIAPVPEQLTAPRDSPCVQPTNLAIPGVTLEQALTLTPAVAQSGNPVQGWANIVLGFPNPLGSAFGCQVTAGPQTMIQQAIALHPTAIIEWLGNNDALVPALIGQLDALTPVVTFATTYETMLDQLKQTGAPIITASIPDVTKVPYFTPLSVIAAEANMSVSTVADKLGLNTGDLLRPTASPIALSILAGKTQGPLPVNCPAPPLQLPAPTVPCVLSVSDQTTVRLTIDAYNVIIFGESLAHGAAFVDAHALVDSLAANGYKANGKQLTLGFLGGIASLDGIHPTNTGYAIIANSFIDVMNQWWGTNIRHANLNEIAAHDPLVPPVKVTKIKP